MCIIDDTGVPGESCSKVPAMKHQILPEGRVRLCLLVDIGWFYFDAVLKPMKIWRFKICTCIRMYAALNRGGEPNPYMCMRKVAFVSCVCSV